jgi:hypothetical protein
MREAGGTFLLDGKMWLSLYKDEAAFSVLCFTGQ